MQLMEIRRMAWRLMFEGEKGSSAADWYVEVLALLDGSS